MRLMVMVVLCCLSGLLSAAEVHVSSQFRPGGYFIGDVVHETMTIIGPPGAMLTEDSLPHNGDGKWVELRGVALKAVGDGRYMLALDWQILKAVRETRLIDLPGFAFNMHIGAQVRSVQVHKRQVMVSPLLPVLLDTTHAELRPDVLPVLRDTQPHRLGVMLALALSLLSGGWLLWRHDLPPFCWRRGGAFTRASRALQRTSDMQEAFAITHRAFDEMAGRAVFADNQHVLFAQYPYLQAVHGDIADFYMQSRHLFFSGEDVEWNVARVRKLCLQLRKLEQVA